MELKCLNEKQTSKRKARSARKQMLGPVRVSVPSLQDAASIDLEWDPLQALSKGTTLGRHRSDLKGGFVCRTLRM